ncbi:hypothetical protein [Marisediminitalea sp.]|uniref:hypothetical protein n=1 Tax=Marisediminitalea sp. TaxID=2662268 RepID=UPI003517E393
MKHAVTVHLKILAILVLFAIYVSLELSLNILLIDMYAQPFELVLGEYHIAAERLELFGRTLSGFGLALFAVTLIPIRFFGVTQSESHTRPVISARGKWLLRPLAFLAIWALIIPSIRVLIDGVVDSQSSDAKLSAVRAIVYKEAYLAKAVSIEGFPEFDHIVADPDRRDLMVALIPSLAFFSNGFNTLIGNNIDSMANTFLLNKQEDDFIAEALPRIRRFDQQYEAQWQLYESASRAYLEAFRKENDHYAREQERLTLLNNANKHINSRWERYAVQLLEAGDFREDYTTNENIRDQYRNYRDQALSSRCNTACEEQAKRNFARYLTTLKFESGESFGISLQAEDVIFNKFVKSKYNLAAIFKRGRLRYLQETYGIPEEMTYEQYQQSDLMMSHLRDYIAGQGITLPVGWKTTDMQPLINAIAAKYQGLAAAEWDKYLQAASYKMPEPGLSKPAFASHAIVTSAAREALGPYYLPAFTPSIAESRYKAIWLDSQDNISFIKMITSTAATTAFSPGGSMFQLGRDAVKLAVIPPASIFASLLAVFLLFFKIGNYLWPRSKVYFGGALLAAVVLLVTPTVSALMQSNAYHNITTRFAQQVSQDNLYDNLLTSTFGYMLDIESGLYSQYRQVGVVREVRRAMLANTEQSTNEGETTNAQNAAPSPLRTFDNIFYDLLSFLPEKLGSGEIIKPFDANITVLKQDLNVGAYLGIYLEGDKVSEVKMPNFMQDTDFGLLAEQKYFYRPDWQSLASEFIENANSPDYWIKLANGDLAKESLVTKIERNMSDYLNTQGGLVTLLKSIQSQGYRNLILLQLGQANRYRCFVIGDIDALMITDSIQSNFVDYKELPNCKARI